MDQLKSSSEDQITDLAVWNLVASECSYASSTSEPSDPETTEDWDGSTPSIQSSRLSNTNEKTRYDGCQHAAGHSSWRLPSEEYNRGVPTVNSSIEWDFVPTGLPRAENTARVLATDLDSLLGDWFTNPEPQNADQEDAETPSGTFHFESQEDNTLAFDSYSNKSPHEFVVIDEETTASGSGVVPVEVLEMLSDDVYEYSPLYPYDPIYDFTSTSGVLSLSEPDPSTSTPIDGLHASGEFFDVTLFGPEVLQTLNDRDMDPTFNPEETSPNLTPPNPIAQDVADVIASISNVSQSWGTKRKAADENESPLELVPYPYKEKNKVRWRLPCSCVDRKTGQKKSFTRAIDAKRHARTTKDHAEKRLCIYGCGKYFMCTREESMVRHWHICPQSGFRRQKEADSDVDTPPEDSRRKRGRRCQY